MKVPLINDSFLNREERKKGGVMVFRFEKIEGKTYNFQIAKNDVKKEQIQIPLEQFQNCFWPFLLTTLSSYLPQYFTSSFRSFISIWLHKFFFKKAIETKSNSTAKNGLE